MAVNCLNQTEKDWITSTYRGKLDTQKDIARFIGTSQRTINRVLVEAGLATPVERIKGDAHTAMKILNKRGIDVKNLDSLLEANQAPTSWSVQAYLCNATKEHLAELFYHSGLAKIEESREMELDNQMAQSKDFAEIRYAHSPL